MAVLLVFVLSIAFRAFAPMPALAYEAGSLIVICSDAGVAEIRIDANGNEIAGGGSPCHDCKNCLACASVAAVDLPHGIAWQNQAPNPTHPTMEEGGFHIRNPAQYWADNRGPPAGTKEARILDTRSFMGLGQLGRRAPWT